MYVCARWFGSSHRDLVDVSTPDQKIGDQTIFVVGSVGFFGFNAMISVRLCSCPRSNDRVCDCVNQCEQYDILGK